MNGEEPETCYAHEPAKKFKHSEMFRRVRRWLDNKFITIFSHSNQLQGLLSIRARYKKRDRLFLSILLRIG